MKKNFTLNLFDGILISRFLYACSKKRTCKQVSGTPFYKVMFLLLAFYTGSELVNAQPYIRTSGGLGQYGYVEKDASATNFLVANGGQGNIYQYGVRSWINGSTNNYVYTGNGSCARGDDATGNYSFGSGTLINGSTIYSSVFVEYCGPTYSCGSMTPTGACFNERSFFVMDVVPKTDALVNIINYNSASSNVVLTFTLSNNNTSGQALNRLWIQNDGTAQESSDINASNGAFRLYYEPATGSETFDGTESSQLLYGNYAGNATNNNLYGNDALNISIPQNNTGGLRCYVVLQGSSTYLNTSAKSKTIKMSIMADGISITPNRDNSFSLMKLDKTTPSPNAITINSTITKQAGNWSSTETWLDGNVPPTGSCVIIAHSVTLDASVSVNSLLINSGVTFTASDNTAARTLTITNSTSGSAITLANNGNWANGISGSTVVFTGAPSSVDAIHVISGTIALQNITVNKTSGSSNVGASFGDNSSVSGTIEIGSGGYISTPPPASFYGTTAILKFNQGTGATYNVNAGDFSWSTTVIPNFITISSGTVNLNAARTASGNLIIEGGTLSLAAMLTIQGNWTCTGGTFTPNSQTVTLSGSGNTIINITTDATLYDLVVNKTGSGYVSCSSNLTVSHDLTISGGVLTIPSTKTLTVAGTLSNTVASGIVLESPSYSGAPGSLKTDGAVSFTGSGSLKAERFIPAYTSNADGWHLISSPVNNPSISSSTNLTPGSTTDDFFAWDEANNLWLNQKDGGNGITNMANGVGYLVAYASASPTIFMTGTPNNIDVHYADFTITPATPDDYRGWHVVGNPYPCAITWNPAGNSYLISNIAGVAKIMGNAGAYSDVNPDGIIPAMQGFSVQATNTTNSFTIPKTARTHNAANWTKSSENNSILITANDLESQMVQESWIRVNDQATEGYDQEYDSHFLPFYAPHFYSKIGDEKLSTNSLPSIPVETVIPFGFVKNDATNFSIELKQSIEGLPVYLTDLKTNTDQNLSENTVYTFTSEAGDDPNRFLLHFLNTTGTVKPSVAQIKVYSAPGKINITGVDGKAEILVRNMMGQVMMRNSVNGSTLQSLNTSNLPAGVYVVSVVSGKQTVSEKVVIK